MQEKKLSENMIRFRHHEKTIQHVKHVAASKNINFSELCRTAFNRGLSELYGIDLYDNKPIDINQQDAA